MCYSAPYRQRKGAPMLDDVDILLGIIEQLFRSCASIVKQARTARQAIKANAATGTSPEKAS